MPNTIKQKSRSMRIIIVGGGIGGLSAAIALRQHGHRPVVLERAARLEPAGAGITLFANAMNALAELGVDKAISAAGSQAKTSEILSADGRVLMTMASQLLEGAVAIHRADLHRVLMAAAPEVRLGVEATSVDATPDGVVVRAADRSEVQGDLVVGADGIWSLVRASIAPSAPRYAGYTVWRGISPLVTDPGRLTETWGSGERFGLVDLGTRTYWFATANLREGERDSPLGRKAALMQRFAGWHPPIEAVLEATPEEAILRNDTYFLDPLPRWSAGRTVLLGDAAHATTPGIGQGAAMAIEDGLVLARELSAATEVGSALERYEVIRRPRAELVLKLSRRTDSAAQLTLPLARLRNLLVRRIPSRLQSSQLEPIVKHRLELPPTP